jgi:hypothetical protein
VGLLGWQGWVHYALLQGLELGGRRYYYTVGDAEGGWSAEGSFLTPPVPSGQQLPGEAVFYVVADMGTCTCSSCCCCCCVG